MTNEELSQKFKDSIDNWTKKIKDNVIDKLKSEDLSVLNNAEVYYLSYREQIITETFNIRNAVFKLKVNRDLQQEKQSKKLMLSSDVRLSPQEKNLQLNNLIKEENERVSYYENYLMFLQESVKTLDNFAYVIKNRYEALKYKAGL